MGFFEQTREVSRAVSTLNSLIRQVISSGGSIYLVDKSNPKFSIKLTTEIDVVCYEPTNFSSKYTEYQMIMEENRNVEQSSE